jgi:hypothetical protein
MTIGGDMDGFRLSHPGVHGEAITSTPDSRMTGIRII